jgi:hypothetical protein
VLQFFVGVLQGFGHAVDARASSSSSWLPMAAGGFQVAVLELVDGVLDLADGAVDGAAHAQRAGRRPGRPISSRLANRLR